MEQLRPSRSNLRPQPRQPWSKWKQWATKRETVIFRLPERPAAKTVQLYSSIVITLASRSLPRPPPVTSFISNSNSSTSSISKLRWRMLGRAGDHLPQSSIRQGAAEVEQPHPQSAPIMQLARIITRIPHSRIKDQRIMDHLKISGITRLVSIRCR